MAKKPNEIFLSLWHQVSLEQMEREDFIECAEAWEKIREMEYADEHIDDLFDELKERLAEIPEPDMYLGDPEEDRRDELGEKINNAPVHHAGESVAREIQIDQHTFADEETVEAEIEAMKEEDGEPKPEKPEGWSAKQKELRERKQEILERLRKARGNHVSAPTIAKAAGVDDTKVYAILNAGQVTIQTYEKVAKGLEKLGY